MPKKINMSQLRSKLRQIDNKRRQEISRYNQEVRKHNQNVKRAADDRKRAVNKYNQEVRAHNNRVRQNRARINSALARIQSKPTTSSFTVYRTSTEQLHTSYARLEHESNYETSDNVDQIFALSEQENANSLETTASLLDGAHAGEPVTEEDLTKTKITEELNKISTELHNRWNGALFSLSPKNPDAARHFCTSAREIFTQVLDITAPNQEVLTGTASCDVTDKGIPTRRAKIHYLMMKKGISNQALEEFVERDVKNIIELFRVFNDGTHGSSGAFNISQLFNIKRRVEDGILFLCGLA